MKKTLLRNFYNYKRKNLNNINLDIVSQQAFDVICCDQNYLLANKIGLYAAINNEIDLSIIFKNSLAMNKQCYFPKCIDDQLMFYQADQTTKWARNKFKILEPITTKNIAIDKLDYLIIPSIACNLQGYRIGYGAGFYDKTLNNIKNKPFLTSIIFAFQLCDNQFQSNYDVAMNKIYTIEI